MRSLLFVFILLQVIIPVTCLFAESPEPYLLEKIGNPGTNQFPTNNSADRYARQVSDLCFYQERVYVGYGDLDNNRGPINVWSFDKTHNFTNEYTVDEEKINLYRVYDSTLFIPGSDAHTSPNIENYYFKTNVNVTWTKRATLTNTYHLEDIAKYSNMLYGIDSGNSLEIGGADGSRLLVSTNDGFVWTMITNQFSVTNYYTYFVDLLPFKESLVFCGVVYEGPRNHYTDTNCYLFRYTAADNTLTNLPIYFDPLRQYQDVLVGYGWGSNGVGGGLAVLTDLDHSFTNFDLFYTNDYASGYGDVVVRSNRCYFLYPENITVGWHPTYRVRYTARIFYTEDLTNWTEMTHFPLPARPVCLEILDGFFYVGCGSNFTNTDGYYDDESGSIWKVGVYFRPTLDALTPTNVMADTAYLGGNIIATNGSAITEQGVYWGTNAGTVLATGTRYSTNGTFGVGAFSFLVTNLPAGRTNYFLAYAVNSTGTSYTPVSSFLTRPPAPAVLAASNGTANAFFANWETASSATNYWLDVAPANDFVSYLAGYSNRMAGAALTYSVTGLQAQTIYYYRVRAQNATGIGGYSGTQTVSLAAIGFLPGSLAYTGTYNGANPPAQTLAVTNPGNYVFDFTNTVTYSASASGWWMPAPTNGRVNDLAAMVITGSVNLAGLNAGTYYATNTVIGAEATNSPKILVTTLTVNKASQAITNFTPTNGSVYAISNTVGLAAQSESGLPVTFAMVSGPGRLDGASLTFTNAGPVSVMADQAGDTNWAAAPSVTNTFSVSKLSQTIMFPAVADQVITSMVRLAATTSSGVSI
jgi:hypothetical protein